jgi:hypothetical protein
MKLGEDILHLPIPIRDSTPPGAISDIYCSRDADSVTHPFVDELSAIRTFRSNPAKLPHCRSRGHRAKTKSGGSHIGRFTLSKPYEQEHTCAIESNLGKALVMPSPLINGVAFCSALFLSGLPLASQTSSFHLEPSAGSLGFETLALVNDSEEPVSIEAYHLVQRCEGGGYWGSTDFFMNRRAASTMPARQAGGTQWPDAIEIIAKGRFQTGIEFVALKNAKGVVEKCERQMDAVLFTDGTHEGSEEAVRTLKAHRDGISDRVNYWENRLRPENRDGSGIDAMHGEAECFLKEDRAVFGEHGSDFFQYEAEPVLDSYWEGRYFVDTTIMEHFSNPEKPPALTFHQLLLQIMWWKEGVDSHSSSKTLDIEFPPLSEPIGACGPELKMR